MNRLRPSHLVFVILGLSACGEARVQPPVSAGQSRDSTTLTLAATDFLHAFDSLDWPRFRSFLSDSVDAYWPRPDSTERLRNRQEVEARYQDFFGRIRASRSGPPYLHLAVSDFSVRQFGEVGIVTFELADVPDTVGRRTIVFRREGGAWRIVHLHASNLPMVR